MIRTLETVVFRSRVVILAILAVLTVWLGWYALQLKMDAGFYKQLPQGHPYIETFLQYQDRLFGANRIIVVLRNKKSDTSTIGDGKPKDDSETIFNQPFQKKLNDVTQDIFFLPGVDRRTVTSLWTPNTRILEITEDGITARDVIPGTVTPDEMSGQAINQLRNDVVKGNLVGRLVSNDFSASMVVAELLEIDPKTQQRLDYFELAAKLERNIRGKHESGDFQIHIIGFAKMIGDIADGAQSVVIFFALAFLLTVASVYYYSRSWLLTWLTVGCSLTSVIWQFGLITVLGFGLDPLAILVPFLVFAIGVSHGVQQVNLITAEVANGASGEGAARASFRGLLIPGSMALITDLVGFAVLYIISIAMIQELAITASIGVALKIITNLVMLPIVASFFKYPENFVDRVNAARDARIGAIRFLGNVANPAIAFPVFIGYLVLFGIAVNESEKRHVGDLHPGAPELRQDERYNVDSRLVAQKFSVGLDLLTVIVETPPLACVNYNYMKHLNEFSWFLRNQPGVRDVQSLPFVAKQINSGWNEGNLKFRDLPRNQFALVQATSPVGTSSGLLDVDCTLLPIQVYLIDGKAETIKPVVTAVKAWIEERGHKPVLSAGTFNSDKVIPVEFLPGGRVKRESSDPTSSWTLTREQLVNLRYNAPPLGEIKPLQFRVEGFAELATDGTPKGDPVAKGTVSVNPDETGAAGVDILSNIRGTEWDNAAHFLIRDVPDGLLIRLASGNSGVAAAVNEEISRQELPTTLAVYVVIIILVFFTYWDWRATLCCCLPLTFATFFGYWFMLNTEIGLKVSTLPVMVLAVGIGVDYAFYIYNRLQYHLSVGLNVTESYKQAITETGNAVIFTAVTLAIGVSTWSFSPLKFQADMGLLLTFMFVINMLMAITALPAMAVVLETLIPRKTRPWAPPGGH